MEELMEDARTVKILEAIEKDASVTQRALSRQCNTALGTINSFLKRLIRKGFVKATTLPRNRLKYFLTPSGLSLKSKLTYEYIRNSLSFYQQARTRTRQVIKALVEEGRTRIAFYGRGDLAEIVYITLQEHHLPLVAIFDSDCEGEDFFGQKVLPESEVLSVPHDALLFTRPNWPGDPAYRGDLPIVHIFEHLPSQIYTEGREGRAHV